MNFWTKALIGLGLIVAVIAVAIALAPYIIGALVVWLAWRWLVGATDDLPDGRSRGIIDVGPTIPHRWPPPEQK